MTDSLNHAPLKSCRRVSQSLSNDRCQNILYKAVFEHFKELPKIAALLLTSKSFQNSSFGANFLVNYIIDHYSIRLLESVLSPSSCFSLQFAPSIHIKQLRGWSERINRSISNFVGELVNTKYLHLSMRALTLSEVKINVVSRFFGNQGNRWPQLQNLKLEYCRVNDEILEIISKSALQLRTISFSGSSKITDVGLANISRLSNITSLDLNECNVCDLSLQHISNLSRITNLNLGGCYEITSAGLEHIAKLSKITSLGFWFCFKITDAGLEHLSELCGISSLNLCGCKLITDAGLEILSNLPALTSLDVSYCDEITGERIASNLPKITCLNLSSSGVTDRGLKRMSKLSGIISLNLSNCNKITDAGLEHVSELSDITELNLSCLDEITNSGLEHIAKLSRLTSLFLANCNLITAKGKKKFKVAVPKCKIRQSDSEN